MPLYSYKKQTNNGSKGNARRQNRQQFQNTHERQQRGQNPVTLGMVISGAYNDFHNLMSTSKIAAMIIPGLLVVSGALIIYRQVWPNVVQIVKDTSGYFDEYGASLVGGDYIELEQPYSNPGSTYFAELKTAASNQDLLFQDEKSGSYQGSFSISIPSLDLYDLNTTANVDSSVEEIYDEKLKDGLAHFQGTSLPHSDMSTYNMVIYGHSSAGDYYQRTKDPAAAFSVLSEIRYGSEIIVNFDGKEYKYKFIKGKVVNANDLSILQGSPGQKQLTLFTCYPNGNNGKRFVATAQLIE